MGDDDDEVVKLQRTPGEVLAVSSPDPRDRDIYHTPGRFADLTIIEVVESPRDRRTVRITSPDSDVAESMLRGYQEFDQARERERTQRHRDVLAVILVLGALGLVLFAPERQRDLSVWFGVALFVVAGRLAGFRRIFAKVSGVEVRADHGESGAAGNKPEGKPPASKNPANKPPVKKQPRRS